MSFGERTEWLLTETLAQSTSLLLTTRYIMFYEIDKRPAWNGAEQHAVQICYPEMIIPKRLGRLFSASFLEVLQLISRPEEGLCTAGLVHPSVQLSAVLPGVQH